jgi:adenosylcobyric acid synthase
MLFVLDSFARLRSEADIVLIEGAGSAAEVNLRANDIANMGFARVEARDHAAAVDVADEHVGTKVVLPDADAALIRGFIVNKFRGDPALFATGMERIAQATGWEALGLVPYFAEARLLPAEDALALEETHASRSFPRPRESGRVKIAVPILPHIANFDDLDPLAARARRRACARAAARGAPRRCRSRGAAWLEGHDRRSCGFA